MSEVSIYKKRARNSVVGKAQLYHKIEGQEDPQAAGQYEGNNWLDCGEDVCPIFSAEEGKWFFNGTQKDIEKLLNTVTLTHESGPKKGQTIKPDDVSLYNPADPLFNHSALQQITEKSKITFKHDNPVDNFLYLCVTAAPETLLPDENNPAVSGDKTYEIIQAGAENKKSFDKVKGKIEVAAILDGNDHTKLMMMARCLNLPAFYPTKDLSPESLVQSLYFHLVEEDGGDAYIEKFTNLAKMTKRELEIREVLTFAIKKGIISSRRDGNFYVFKGNDNNEILDGIMSEDDLVERLKTKDGIALENEDDLLSYLRQRFKENK